MMLTVALLLLCAGTPTTDTPPKTAQLDDIHIRDPFVLAEPREGLYYLYGTNSPGPGVGLDVYTSRDLVTWTGPMPVFRPPKGFWASQDFWAPEVHSYRGQYYMLASFKAPTLRRGTQILRATSPRGPFTPLTDQPITPRDWDCLDGTLYLDPSDQPWMVFCHEWTQIGDGTICAMRLAEDLTRADEPPITLFKGSDAPWIRPIGKDKASYVTDGPFLYRSHTGALLMLWSSVGAGDYTLGLARSTSGAITGPWTQDPAPLFGANGGHAMLFRSFDGGLLLSLHQPNKGPNERTKLFVVKETGDGTSLRLIPWTRPR